MLRFRWIFLVLNFTITGFMGYQAWDKLTIDNSTEAFMGDKADEIIVLDELYDDFGQDNIYQILVEGDVFSMSYLERLKALHDDLAVIDLQLNSLGQRRRGKSAKQVDDPFRASPVDDGSDAVGAATANDPAGFEGFDGDEGWGDEGGSTIVEEIISLINVRRTAWKGGGLEVAGLLDEWPTKADLPALKQRVLNDEVLVGQVVGAEGRHSVVIVRTDFLDERDLDRVFREVVAITDKHHHDGFHISVAGLPAFNASLNEMMLQDFYRLTLIALAVMTLVLALIFRHPLGIIGPVLVVWQSAGWTLGAMAISGVPMTMLTNVLPAFLACVGVGGSVHIQSVYRDGRGRGIPNQQAIIYAISTTGVPVFYTTLTTAVGLISFRFATLGAIIDMGTFGALGIAVTLIHSLVFLPVMLSFNNKSLLGVKPGETRRDLLNRFLNFCNYLSRPSAGQGANQHLRRRMTLWVSAGFTLIVAAGATTLVVHHDALSWIPEDRDIRQAMDEMDRHVGGTANVALLISAKEDQNLKDRDLLIQLEKLENHISAYQDPKSTQPIVGTTTSLLDVIRESWRAVNESNQAFYRIPDTERGVVDMFTLFENAAPDQLKRLTTVDFVKSLMTIRVNWMDAWSYKPLTAHIAKGVEEFIGDRAIIKTTGSVFCVSTVVSALISDLIRSFGVAFIAITIVMVLLLRDIKLGLISMVPNLLPVVSVMGIMGFASIPLDTANLIIASIVIGIAVDDTIHFLHQFRVHYADYGDVDAAIDHAFSHTGRAMTSTSIILVMGFLVFLAATMYPLARFGALAGLAIIFALLFDLIVGPALLRLAYRSKPREKRL
ncbi:MAG: MMPL family transporter [Myxococcota bacterium]|nr:MMPL family transporter [Myxococcota bacterium]